jgi:hypothetical protein
MSGFGGNPVVPAAVASLDLAEVAEVLARHACNVTDAAAALAVPSSDLRRLLWANPKLQDQAFEVVESRIDKAEKNITEALHSDDPRMRVAASMFTIRNAARAKRRGWITSAAASVEVNIGADPPVRTITYRWRNESDDDKSDDDNGGWQPPVYGDGRREGYIESAGSVAGELASPSALLEHEAAEPEPAEEPAAVEHAAAAEPEPAVIEAPAPAVESAAVRYERERIDAWIRNRLIAYPLASCVHCRKPIIAGQDWQEASNGEARARFHRSCYAEWRGEHETAARRALGLARGCF